MTEVILAPTPKKTIFHPPDDCILMYCFACFFHWTHFLELCHMVSPVGDVIHLVYQSFSPEYNGVLFYSLCLSL